MVLFDASVYVSILIIKSLAILIIKSWDHC